MQNITKYIGDAKIFIGDIPNLSYPCELCEADIRKGNLCHNCRVKINTDIEKMNRQEDQDRKKLIKKNQASFKIKDRFNQ